MAAGHKALGDFVGGHYRAHGQAVGQRLGAGNGVGPEIEVLEGPRLARAEKPALHFVHEEEDILFTAERLNALGVFGVHGPDATFTLHDFHEHGGSFRRYGGFKGVQITPRHGLEAFGHGREAVLKAFLPRGGHGRVGAPVKSLVERDDLVGVAVPHPLHVAPGQLDLRFVGLRAGIAEEGLAEVGEGEQLLGQIELFLLIKKVAHVDELAGLFFDDLRQFLVAMPEARHRDARQQVDVFLAVDVGKPGALAAGDGDGIAPVAAAEEGFFTGFDGVERGSAHGLSPVRQGPECCCG